ncbi:FecR family protein [Hydrocarboniphaga effusa]|jgi:transmembrane sensor|uniref:FecR family protein n=1 Tax=Hydrocarboniphaga effusa TaxID=243629 RepID=UPI0035B49EF0
MNTTTTTEATLEEAARWSARLCAPDCSDRDRADFERWMLADESHADAFAATQLLSDGVGLLADADAELAAMADEAYAMGAEGDPAVAVAAPPRTAQQVRRAPQRRRWTLPAGLAAGVVAAIIGLSAMQPHHGAPSGERYAAVDAARRIELADGSIVQLDVGSEMRVELTPRERRIDLERGRALFEVAHDSTRPFAVSAARSRTTALGTRFQVQNDADTVTVTLTEGSVAVEGLGSRDRHRERLEPGDQLRIAPERDGRWVRRRVDSEVVTSWSHGRLVFRGTPLSEALTEINRYSRVQVHLGDPDLGRLLVSGNFIPGDNRSIASAIASVLPLRPIESGDEILLFGLYGSGD